MLYPFFDFKLSERLSYNLAKIFLEFFFLKPPFENWQNFFPEIFFRASHDSKWGTFQKSAKFFPEKFSEGRMRHRPHTHRQKWGALL